MRTPPPLACLFALFVSLFALPLHAQDKTPAKPAPRERGRATAETQRPDSFPHRIWAACDFEEQPVDYGWFGAVDRKNFPDYKGNFQSLGVGGPNYKYTRTLTNGINPVPGPRMGKENHLYLRYYFKGAAEATFQYFSLTREDNNHIHVTGLTEGKWSQLTLNFTRDARRNDGSPEAFAEGERMDDFKIYMGKPGDTRAEEKKYEMLIDDVIFFSNDPKLPAEKEPFPNRVIFLAAFDTGEKDRHWRGDLEIVEKDLPEGAWWRVAKAVPRKDGKGKLVRLQIDPPRPVGEHTKLRFRYHLTGTTEMTAQIFDATVQDNRHIRLKDLKQNEWTTIYLDFTKDSRRNDGSAGKFTAGNRVDDLFFFIDPPGAAEGKDEVQLLIDEVVLFDAGKK